MPNPFAFELPALPTLLAPFFGAALILCAIAFARLRAGR
jgi:hypothetical protein